MNPDYAKLTALLDGHIPRDEQEAADIALIRTALARHDDLLTRQNPAMHITAASLILDESGTKTLLCWHNLYKSWSWTGGHADGDGDLLAVALREAQEETGAVCTGGLFLGVDILPVPAHEKRGSPVAAHRHLNFTFLLRADRSAPIAPKPDENSGVGWFPLEQLPAVCSEPHMVPVYRRLLAALAE